MEEKIKKPIYKRWWFWAIVIVVLIAFASGGDDDKTTQTNAPGQEQTERNDPGISMAEFEQLKSGMTYEEVTEIIGGPGEVMSESGNPGEDLHTIMYMYKGENGLGSNANIMFQGNKLNNKAQFGLD